MSSNHLFVEKLCATAGKKALLHEVSAQFPAGQLSAIIGPNGAGKSSLLKAIMGELNHTGDVLIGGAPLHQLSMVERSHKIAMLSQHTALSFPFTAEEVVMLGRTHHGTGKQQDTLLCETLMERLDLMSLSRQYYPLLSGGEKQRVQLARVLAQVWDNDQSWLLLDEPTSSLDPGHKRQVMNVIDEFVQLGGSVVMVSHDITLAATYASHVLSMHHGCMALFGATEEVITERHLASLYDVPIRVVSHPDTGKPVVLGA